MGLADRMRCVVGLGTCAAAVACGVAGSAAEVGPAVLAARQAGGVRIVMVKTSRRANVAVHDELHQAVVTAVRRVMA